jgi:hypothetical protein
MLSLIVLLQAQAVVPTAERQIEWAVQAAPERLRADATVIGFGPDGKPTTLRKGTGLLICLADDPKQPNHHVSCYHRDLDPFMSRGRELRSAGLKDPAIDSTRLAEIKAGKLKLPTQAAALYQLFAQPGNADPATGEIKNTRSLYVVYLPYATPETTGIGLAPKPGMPWLMDPGLPWAHIMISQ